MTLYSNSTSEPIQSRVFKHKKYGGDGLTLFETLPLEDVLADIASGWNDTRLMLGSVRRKSSTEVNYVL